MNPSTSPFGPYRTSDELGRGRRKMFLSLGLAVTAVVLAVVAQRSVGDGRLVTVYLAAGLIWFVAGLAEAVRWSNTGELEPTE